jgi:SAM-dependent methyltransferase
MDSEALSFPDASFDAVTCRIAPHHFLDVPAALREIARVLRPGGHFALEDSIAPPDPALDSFINEVEKLRDPTHVRSYTEAEWRFMLEAAGLEIRSSQPNRKSHDIPEWIERSDIGPDATERVYDAFAAAPPAARQHFNIHYQNGRATTFTDDKLIFRADKPS